MDWFRHRRERGRPAHPDVLTPAEWRVLEGVRDGLPNAEIAVRLGVSVNTVRYHVSNMLAKLDLPDRGALAAWDGEPAPASLEAMSGARRGSRMGMPFLGWLGGKAGAVAAVGVVAGIGALALLVLPSALADDPREPVREVPDATPADPDREPGAFEAMLAFVPDRPEFRGEIRMEDRARIETALGDAPWDPGEEDRDYFLRLAQRLDPAEGALVPPAHFLGMWGRNRDFMLDVAETMRRTLGFGFGDARQSVTIVPWPPDREVGVSLGRFDPARAAALLAACADCEPHEVAAHRGVTYWRWGDGEPNPALALAPPARGVQGQPVRIAMQEDLVVRAMRDEDIEAILDAVAGVGTLASDENFRLVAEHLDREGAPNGYLTDVTHSPELGREVVAGAAGPLPDNIEAAWDVDRQTALAPYLRWGWGTAYDAESSRAYTVLVLVHDDPAQAAANLDRIEARLREFEPLLRGASSAIESVEAEVHGRVLVARVRGLDLWRLNLRIEPLLLHR